MRTYRIKVTEIHSDYVWVEADSADQAKDLAIGLSACEFEAVDCEVASIDEEDE